MDRPDPPTDSDRAAADALVQLAAGPTPEEVRKTARERSASVLSNWKLLVDILDRHEDGLRKRWMKKNKTWRKMVLSKAWPNMPRLHRPDFRALGEEVLEGARDIFMWPYINMEDLSLEKPLLILLNSRARSRPAAFADFEIDLCRLGIDNGVIVLFFMQGYTMYMEGQTTDTYGKLVAIGDYAGGYNNNTSAGIEPSDGLLILEIQQKLMEFLTNCCEIILEKPAEALTNQYPIGTRLPRVEVVSQWLSTEILARYGPYRTPRRPDFHRLKTLLDARHSAAIDHIWALKEDPGYFADILYDEREHREETIRDTVGKIHISYGEPVFWDEVIKNAIFDAYGQLFAWDMICRQADHVVTLQNKYAKEIDPRDRLPGDYYKAIQVFRHLLVHFSYGTIANLGRCMPGSPPLRSLYVRELLVNGGSRTAIRADVDLELDALLWLCDKLFFETQRQRYGVQELADEIERLVVADPKQNERLSPWIAGQFADLGLWVRTKHEVDSYQPWAAEFKKDDELFKKEMESETSNRFAVVREMHSIFPTFTLTKVGCPCSEKFFYPSDKRQSKSNAQSMRNAERNLDLFWEELERQFEMKAWGKTFETAFGHLIPVKHELDRTPEWIESSEATSGKGGANEATVTVDDLPQAVSDLRLGQQSSSAGYAPGLAAYSIRASDVLPEPNPVMVKVDSRAFRVFKALFYTPSDFDGPGDIPWADFLHTMHAVGFSPIKLYGSLWHFDTEEENTGPIQFHEPRPHPKISLRLAMRMGRRLKRAYGWHAEMFGLEKGKGKSSS